MDLRSNSASPCGPRACVGSCCLSLGGGVFLAGQSFCAKAPPRPPPSCGARVALLIPIATPRVLWCGCGRVVVVGWLGWGGGGGMPLPTPLSLPPFKEATGSRNAQDYILERSLEYSGTQSSSILELSVPIVGRLFVRAPERLAPDWILEFRGGGGVRLWLGSGACF